MVKKLKLAQIINSYSQKNNQNHFNQFFLQDVVSQKNIGTLGYVTSHFMTSSAYLLVEHKNALEKKYE